MFIFFPKKILEAKKIFFNADADATADTDVKISKWHHIKAKNITLAILASLEMSDHPHQNHSINL